MSYAILLPNGYPRTPPLAELNRKNPAHQLAEGERQVGYNPPPHDAELQTCTPILPVPADAQEVSFVVADKPLAEALPVAQARKWDEIKRAREAEIVAPTMATPMGVIDADDDSLRNITRTLVAWREALAIGAGPATIDWTMADNSAVPMTISELGQVAALMLGRGDAAYQKARALRAQIDGATTLADVLAVVW